MMASEGRRLDEYLAVQPRPVAPGVLNVLKIKFDYLECNGGCGTTLETAKLTNEVVGTWRFSLMGLKPSILGAAHGTCPICQDLQKQFSKILRP